MLIYWLECRLLNQRQQGSARWTMDQEQIDRVKQVLESLRRPNKDPNKQEAGKWQMAADGRSVSITLPAGHVLLDPAATGARTLPTMLEDSQGAYTVTPGENGATTITLSPRAQSDVVTGLGKLIYRQEANLKAAGQER